MFVILLRIFKIVPNTIKDNKLGACLLIHLLTTLLQFCIIFFLSSTFNSFHLDEKKEKVKKIKTKQTEKLKTPAQLKYSCIALTWRALGFQGLSAHYWRQKKEKVGLHFLLPVLVTAYPPHQSTETM